MVMRSFASLSVASAQTSRHAGVRDDRRLRRMHVLLRPTDAQLEVRDPLEAEADRRPAGGVLVPGLPDAAIGAKSVAVLRDERGEMLRADLLLALVEDADAQRQLADRVAVRLDRLQPRHEVAFVVGDAPSEEHAVALGGLERGCLPFVVVVVHQERAVTAADLADDGRRSSVDAQRLRRDAGLLGAGEHSGGGLIDGRTLCRDRRQAHQRLQLVDVTRRVRADVPVERVERAHAARWGRSSCGSCCGRARSAASTARSRSSVSRTGSARRRRRPRASRACIPSRAGS